MTAPDLLNWYYGIAEYLNGHLAEIGALGVYARFPGESFESPAPAIVLLLEFATNNPPLALSKPAVLRIEITMLCISGQKASTRDSATESLTMLQAAARLMRTAYAGDLMLSAAPLEIVELSSTQTIAGLVYEKLVAFV